MFSEEYFQLLVNFLLKNRERTEKLKKIACRPYLRRKERLKCLIRDKKYKKWKNLLKIKDFEGITGVNSLLTIQQQQPIHILNLVKEFEKDIERAHTLIKKQPVGSQKFEASTNKYEDFKSTFDSYKNKILSFGKNMNNTMFKHKNLRNFFYM
jgi:hypothetical protein